MKNPSSAGLPLPISIAVIDRAARTRQTAADRTEHDTALLKLLPAATRVLQVGPVAPALMQAYCKAHPGCEWHALPGTAGLGAWLFLVSALLGVVAWRGFDRLAREIGPRGKV